MGQRAQSMIFLSEPFSLSAFRVVSRQERMRRGLLWGPTDFSPLCNWEFQEEDHPRGTSLFCSPSPPIQWAQNRGGDHTPNYPPLAYSRKGIWSQTACCLDDLGSSLISPNLSVPICKLGQWYLPHWALLSIKWDGFAEGQLYKIWVLFGPLPILKGDLRA